MEEWIKVVILGIVEGITEYLPVSSTGHLIIASNFLELKESLRGVFEIFIQIGAVVAVIAYYRAELLAQATQARTNANVRHLWMAIVIAFIPAAAIGFLFSLLLLIKRSKNRSVDIYIVISIVVINFLVQNILSQKVLASGNPLQLPDMVAEIMASRRP